MMKTERIITNLIQYPTIWSEEWLQIAYDDLHSRVMDPEERYAFERILFINSEIVHREKRKEEQLLIEARSEIVRRALYRSKRTIEEIAEANNVSVDFVLSLQAELS